MERRGRRRKQLLDDLTGKRILEIVSEKLAMEEAVDLL